MLVIFLRAGILYLVLILSIRLMFGYVTADAQLLTPEQAARYKSCYCGLCRALREQYGQAARLSLTYDMSLQVPASALAS